MRAPKGLTVAERFFWANAGYSYGNGESREAGRERCARNLAAVEGIAREAGYTFDWQQDDCDSSEWSGEVPAWPQYCCIMRDATGRVVQSLGCIDFGKDANGPYGDYRRVVEAGLAAEECGAVLAAA